MKRGGKTPPYKVRHGVVFDPALLTVRPDISKSATSNGGSLTEVKFPWTYGGATAFDIISFLTIQRYVPPGTAPDITNKEGRSISIKETPVDLREAEDYLDIVAGFNFLRAFAACFRELYRTEGWFRGFGADNEAKMPPKGELIEDPPNSNQYRMRIDQEPEDRFKIPVTVNTEYGDELKLNIPKSLEPRHAANDKELTMAEIEQLSYGFRVSFDKRQVRSHRSKKWHLLASELDERSGGIDYGGESFTLPPMIANMTVWSSVWWKPDGKGNFQGCGLTLYCQQMSLYTDSERGMYAPPSIASRFSGPEFEFERTPLGCAADWFKEWRLKRLRVIAAEKEADPAEKRQMESSPDEPEEKRLRLEEEERMAA